MFVLSMVLGFILLASIKELVRFINGLVKLKSTTTPNIALLWNLAFISVIQALFGTNTVFISTLTGHDMRGYHCQLDAAINTSCAFGMIFQLTTLCVVQINPKFHGDGYLKKIAPSFCIVWGVSWAVLPLFGIGKWVPHCKGVYCCLDFTSDNFYDQSYFVLLTVFGFALPVCLMVTLSFLPTKIERTNTALNDETYSYQSHGLKNIFPIVFVFTILWVPTGVVATLRMLGFNEYISDYIDLFDILCGFCSYVTLCHMLSNQLEHILEKKGKNMKLTNGHLNANDLKFE